MREKLREFWRAPFFNKLYWISTGYYRLKGALIYRVVFNEFGRGSFIRKPLLILNAACISIGEHVGIRDGVRLEVVRSSKSRIPSLSIGNNTNIEQNVHVVCHSRIRIGNNVSITGNSAIVDVTHPFEDVLNPEKIGARITDEDSFVEIGDGAFLGYGCVVLPNVRIGTCAVIGANSVVVSDVPDYSVAAGVPAVVLKRYDWEQRRWERIAPDTTPQAAHEL